MMNFKPIIGEVNLQLEPILVHVHPADNGFIGLFEDSNAAQAGKVLAMTISTGALGLIAYGVTRGIRAQCETCGRVFARDRYSHQIEKKLTRLLQSGELVLRAYTPPPIVAYDPNETHALAPNMLAEQRKTAEDKLYGPVIWSSVLLFFMGAAAIYGLTDHFRFDFAHIAAEITMFYLCALLAEWFLRSIKALQAGDRNTHNDTIE